LRNYIAFFFLLDGFLNVDPIFPQGVVASTRATSYYGKGNLLYVLLKKELMSLFDLNMSCVVWERVRFNT